MSSEVQDIVKTVLVLKYVTEDDLKTDDDISNVVVKIFEKDDITGDDILSLLDLYVDDLHTKDVYLTEGNKLISPTVRYSQKQVLRLQLRLLVVLFM